jgi:ActR/RegA family two-component response regulator
VLGKHVLIADAQYSFAHPLGVGFERLGYRSIVVGTMDSALERAGETRPELIICEQRVGAASWLDLLKYLRDAAIPARIAIVTASGSFADAVFATKLGVSAYLAKPVTPKNIIDAVTSPIEQPPDSERQSAYCSLERAKWEYINMMVATAGSIAEAARRLRIERRSLRRMLAKAPPAQ